jgi:hypothetical protein
MRRPRAVAPAAVVVGLVLLGAAGCGVDTEEAPRLVDTITTAPPLPVPTVRQRAEPTTAPCPTPTSSAAPDPGDPTAAARRSPDAC